MPLLVCRGFSSESVVQDLAVSVEASRKPCVILSLNDYDPSGQLMLADIIRRARHYAPRAEFVPVQVALTRDQVSAYDLPTRPTKRDRNPHASKFRDERSVELDALDPDVLRDLVRDAITGYIDRRAFEVIKEAERSERATLENLATHLGHL